MVEAPKNSVKGMLVAFIVGQSQIQRTAKQVEYLKSLHSAPHYFGLVPPQKILGHEKRKVNGSEASFTIKTYIPDIIIAEAVVPLDNIFNETNLDLKDQLLLACREILQKHKIKKDTDEEYGVWCVGSYQVSPDVFLADGRKIASFLKSEKLELSEEEITSTLASSLKYAQNDLTIVDWDGAFVFEPKGQFGPMVELFQIANFQLLRYRILDSELDQKMKRVSELFKEREKKVFFRSQEVKQTIKELIAMRSSSILDFESTERDIKLVGDWYSARLYDLTAKKFHFDEWRSRIQTKLDAIGEIYSMVAENFNVSARSRLETIQLVGWLILMIGWSVLMVFEFAALFN